ncbi:hypothetical protein SBOR_3273 [Sclerotinia borealis F-4128]|uniref:Uncharacterized protein n=1 Tax=Sclerotinia borealis (strain F-4128) TaxID=1432307 RepID=W9CKI2_SCLBF|nr:hypothetical protein SBOR_3273 [Sclerotinia borealis F-4128]
MSTRNHPTDSFLPSAIGVFDMAHLVQLPLSDSGTSPNSPMSTHRHHLGQGSTAYFSPPNTSSPAQQYIQHSPPSGGPISPPRTRSASAENTSSQLIEDFRKYSQNLRDQYEGELAHILADKQRAQEVIAEERTLWDKERRMLISRIRDLEARLAAKGEEVAPAGIFNLELGNLGFRPVGNMFTNPTGLPIIRKPAKVSSSPAGSSEGKKSSHSHPEIKQESGRNADGSPFYAPAPQNPTRTFSTESEGLRVEDIHAPSENPIQVTQELTPSDFVGSSQYASPEVFSSHQSGIHWEEEESIGGDVIGADSIDISRIAPHLEGVPIKASAVDPVFVANVLSPRSVSPRLSPNVEPPGRDVGISLRKADLEPENKRLTMYAGHTPNHSISRFSDLVKESDEAEGDETPRGFDGTVHRGSLAPIPDGDEGFTLDVQQPDEDEEVHDRPLTGPLGLTNVPARDEFFLEALTERLEEVKNSRPGSKETTPCVSPGTSSPILEMKKPRSRDRDIGGGGDDGRGMEGEERGFGDEEGSDEVGDESTEILLRLKPTMNFGRPMGFR